MGTAVKGVKFVSDRISYLVLTGFWCDICMNSHAPAGDEGDWLEGDSFYEELEQPLRHFRKASTHIAKVWVGVLTCCDAGTSPPPLVQKRVRMKSELGHSFHT